MRHEQAPAKWGQQRLAYLRLAVFALLVLLVILMNRCFGWSVWFSNLAQLPLLQASLRGNMVLAILLYMAVTVVGCVVLALPGLLFAVAAGLLFGPLWGTLACVFAATVGAALAFVVGRFFLRDALQPWIEKNPRLRRILFEQAGQRDIYVLMITRLLPIFPYNLQNFAYGVTNIRFCPYTIYSFLFMLPGTAMYTVAAAGLVSPGPRPLYWSLATLLLVTVVACSLLLRRCIGPKEDSREQ